MLFRSNDTATTEIYTACYTLSLHDALPISAAPAGVLVLMNCQPSAEYLAGQIAGWTDPKAVANPGGGDRHGLRTYGIGAQILRDLNVGQMRLLARPRKMPSMAGFALTITGYDCDPPETSRNQQKADT